MCYAEANPTCPCGDDDGMPCSLDGCPYPTAARAPASPGLPPVPAPPSDANRLRPIKISTPFAVLSPPSGITTERVRKLFADAVARATGKNVDGSERRETAEPGPRPIRAYLAGPMAEIPYWNYPAFNAAAAHLRSCKFEIYNPAEFAPGDADNFPVREAFAAFTRYISREAEWMILLPGWETSVGAAAEVALARACGLHIVTYPDMAPVRDDETAPRHAAPRADLWSQGAYFHRAIFRKPGEGLPTIAAMAADAETAALIVQTHNAAMKDRKAIARELAEAMNGAGAVAQALRDAAGQIARLIPYPVETTPPDVAEAMASVGVAARAIARRLRSMAEYLVDAADAPDVAAAGADIQRAGLHADTLGADFARAAFAHLDDAAKAHVEGVDSDRGGCVA